LRIISNQSINDNQLIALAKVFDVSVDWLTNFSAQQIFENVSNSLFYGTNSTQNNHINEELIQALTLQLKEKDEQIKHLMQQLSKKDEVIDTLRKQF
jgi:hypothetical protein